MSAAKAREKKELKSEVNPRSSKQEILDAYEALLKQKEAEQGGNEITLDSEKSEEALITAAEAQSADKIVMQLAELKLNMGKAMDELADKLAQEVSVFSDLRKAVEIKKKELQASYGIKAEADSLSALIQVHKEKKAELQRAYEQTCSEQEDQIEELKSQYEKNKESFEQNQKAEQEKSQRDWQREEEEYAYKTKQQRQKDTDEYAGKKKALEQELAEKKTASEIALKEREQAIAEKEKELVELREKATRFPEELAKAQTESRKKAIEEIETGYKHQNELQNKEIEGERKLFQQRIAALEDKIKEQNTQIKELAQKANDAGHKVESIALKAIEGASQRVYHVDNSTTSDMVKVKSARSNND